jgi:hypothetical protein
MTFWLRLLHLMSNYYKYLHLQALFHKFFKMMTEKQNFERLSKLMWPLVHVFIG